MSVDLKRNTYLPKPDASPAVVRACEGKAKHRLNGWGKSMAFFTTMCVGDILTCVGMWLAYWLFHQHVNAYPEGIFALTGLFGCAITGVWAADQGAGLTKAVTPRNFEKQAVKLSATEELLTKRNAIIKDFQGFAPERVLEITQLVNSTIFEIEDAIHERDRVWCRYHDIDPTSGEAALNLRAVLNEKYELANAKVEELKQKLKTLQKQSHEAYCSLELAKETGRSLTPVIPLQTPTPQLDEMNEWLAALAKAYSTNAITA